MIRDEIKRFRATGARPPLRTLTYPIFILFQLYLYLTLACPYFKLTLPYLYVDDSSMVGSQIKRLYSRSLFPALYRDLQGQTPGSCHWGCCIPPGHNDKDTTTSIDTITTPNKL